MTLVAGPLVVGAVLAAAVLHASWNALAKHATDRLGMFVRTSVIGAIIGLPVLLLVDPPDRASWPFLAGSICVHTLYNIGLLAAYRLGDFNQTYPLARGIGPLGVAVVAAVALDEPLSGLPALGVLLIAVAIGVLGLTPWQRVRENRPAVIAAVLTGLAIATYTLLDGVGVRRSGNSLGYTLWLLGTHSLVTVLALVALRPVIARYAPTVERTPAGTVWPAAVAACVMSMLAYSLVLWAQTRGALAAVAALRESSVVVAAVIGVLLFKEPLGRVRVAAAVGVAAGVVLLAVPS